MRLLMIMVSVSVAFAQKPSSKATPEHPEFFDEPTFIVSGMTDYTYRGGHGSDAVLRSTEALTAATSSLKTKSTVTSSISTPTPAEREHALAESDEKRGNSLEAVREYQRAAELDASESNFFDWGLELLIHRAADPAIEVFTKGSHLFPGSSRMILAIAVASYMRRDYENAAQYFFRASDLNPEDPTPYMFLGQVRSTFISRSQEYLQKMAQFASLQPDNAWANYYYAECLWKQRTNDHDVALATHVQQLLDKAIRTDPNLSSAYLLLGIVYSEQKDLLHAISSYRKAIEISPDLEEAHYRLSQVYELSGEKAKAQEQRDLYTELSNKSGQRAEQERKEVRQFVFTLRDAKPDH